MSSRSTFASSFGLVPPLFLAPLPAGAQGASAQLDFTAEIAVGRKARQLRRQVEYATKKGKDRQNHGPQAGEAEIACPVACPVA
jgi:hypothetical protein